MVKADSLKDITEQQLGEFRTLINKAGGKAMVIVHPHYVTPGGGSSGVDFSKYKKSKKYKKYLERVNRTMENSNWPVIVLESEKNFEETNSFLKSVGKKALVLPTHNSSLNLALESNGLVTKHDSEKSSGLIKLFSELGIRKVLVGGSFARLTSAEAHVVRHEKKWLPKRLRPSKSIIGAGCVGRLYSNLILSGKFEVRLGKGICFPNQPKFVSTQRKIPNVAKLFSRLRRRH